MQKANAVVGHNFVISIDSNPTTGHTWQPDYEKSALQLVDSKFIPQSNLLGSAGRQEFEFKPLKAGTFTIEMTYKRSWEKESVRTARWIIEVS